MSNQRRLPLPGEQPTGVWRPPRRRVINPWRRVHGGPIGTVWKLLPWIVGAVLLWVAIVIWRATGTPVTVVVNGQPVELRTHRRSVEGALQLAGVSRHEAVYINPSPETPLEPGMLINAIVQRPIMVHADGQIFLVDTRSTDPRAIADELGLILGPHDEMRVERAMRPTAQEIRENPALALVASLPREIRLVRAQRVIVNETLSLTGEQIRVSFETTEPTLGLALASAGYAIYQADRVSPPLGTSLAAGHVPPEGLEVRIERSTPVTVQADGRDYILRTHQQRVGALLDEVGLALVGDDYAQPDPAAWLEVGMHVRVVRVHYETLDDDSPIPYRTVYVPDPDLELDQQREIQPGQGGTLRRQVRIRYEDGRETSRVVVGEWVVEHPRARVVGYGIRIVIRTLETPYGPVDYWRKLRVLATSYSPQTAGHKKPGDPFYGLSGTGAPMQRGIIATDPRVIPLYTRMYVPGYGLGQALDVGGAIKGMRIDLGYDDANYVMWNNWVDLYLLVPVTPPDQMVWVLPG